MNNSILYESGRIKITYLHSPELRKEDEIVSVEDHELWLSGKDGKENRYIIQRGILRDLSKVTKDGLLKLRDMLNIINPAIYGIWKGRR